MNYNELAHDLINAGLENEVQQMFPDADEQKLILAEINKILQENQE